MMLYLDNAATTKPLHSALAEFSSVSETCFGNPSSIHGVGYEASRVLESARSAVLAAFGISRTHQCIFLSGASEANSLAFKGVGFQYRNRGNKILVSAVEHPSVLNLALQMKESFGFDVVVLPVNSDVVVEPSTLEAAMDSSVILVSLMAVNNETGSVFDIPSLSKIVKRFPKAFFHVDATQAVGKIPLPYGDIDLLSFSAHKIGGLKGSGCLLYKRTMRLLPLIPGGEQEFGVRSGTVAVPLAASTAIAVKEALVHQAEHYEAVSALATRLREGLSSIEEVELNSPENGSPFVLNFSLRRHKASVIVESLSEQGIYVSSVSACHSRNEATSYVLEAMGKDPVACGNSIRVSMSHEQNSEDVDAFLASLKASLERLNPR